MEKKVVKLNGQADDAQITKWKQEYKDGIYYIKSPTDIAYFREPMVFDVETAYAAADDDHPFASIKEFGRLTFIGGSEEILKDDRMFLGAKTQLVKHWSGIKATSGNL